MSRRSTQVTERPNVQPRGRHAVIGAPSSIWETPDGLAVELARLDGEFSSFDREITDAVLTRGFRDHVVVEPLRPLVDLYRASWLPLLLRWRGFYQENKNWAGRPWQWTHAEEMDRHASQLSEIRSLALPFLAPTISPAAVARPSPVPTPGAARDVAPISTSPSPGEDGRAPASASPPVAGGPGELNSVAVAMGALGALAIVVALAGGRS